jgi:hypothetical protein
MFETFGLMKPQGLKVSGLFYRSPIGFYGWLLGSALMFQLSEIYKKDRVCYL